MSPRALFSLSALVLIAACEAPDVTENTVAAPEAAPSESAANVKATKFLTANETPPQSAADTKGDGVYRDAEGRPFAYALLGQKLPAFTAPMSDGRTFDSTALNRWTVIDVWGAWCSDCVADGPYVAALERAIAQDPDLDFLSIHVPASAARATPEEMFGKYGSLDAYFASAGYSFPVVIDTDASVRDALQISWTPSYLLVSPDGIVRGFRTDLSVVEDQPVKSFIKDIARVRGEVRDATRRTISAAGVASLDADTAFTVSAVEKAFPDFDVIPIVDPESGASSFEIRPDGSEAARFIVESDWSRGYVAIVSSRSGDVHGPLGEKIGAARFAELPLEKRALCADPLPANGGHEFTCPDPAAPEQFTRVYRLEGGADSADRPNGDALLVELRFAPEVP
ncbi:MAG: TlpA family protein disulfide reductase [Acidobacteria bacterium]|nr:TlpA family protein disulfide reductase [Acidobacteriota bacterium]